MTEEIKPASFGLLPLSALGVYEMSRRIEFLRLSKPGDPLVYQDGSVEKDGRGFILGNLIAVADLLTHYGLAKSETSSLTRLISRFQDLVKHYMTTLQANDLPDLAQAIARVEALVQSSVRERNFIETRPTTGLLDYSKLLASGAKGLFRDEKIVNELPSMVRDDLEDAVRCLAYNIPTASVMIALRATEGMLRHAQTILFRTKTLEAPQSSSSWAKLQEDVSAGLARTGVAMLELEGYLNFMRTIRNQAEHPDKRFNIKEAEDVLIHAQYAISEVEKLLELVPFSPKNA